MSPYPDSPEEWSAIVGTILALLIVWKKYRSERRDTMAETCAAHISIVDRLDKSERDRAQIKTTLTDHGQQIAVTVALLRELKEDVQENRRLVASKLDDVGAALNGMAVELARGRG